MARRDRARRAMNAAAALTAARRAVPRWPGWRRLPREARDTLFLLAVIAWTVLPHASHLPAWAIALTAVVLVWRGRLALSQRRAARPLGAGRACSSSPSG